MSNWQRSPRRNVITNFASKNPTVGQLNALVKKLGGEQSVRDYLSGKVKVSITKSALERSSEFTLPTRMASFNPNIYRYFKTRNGLYVSDDFNDKILRAIELQGSVPSATIVIYCLTKDADDTEIREEMPNNHVFEDTYSFCTYLAYMIDEQQNGRTAVFVTNGNWNIFYVRGVHNEIFSVNVRWRGVLRRWEVSAYIPDGECWSIGSCAFSCNINPQLK